MSKKQYTRSYKLDAVKLAIQGDESIAQTAENLGVHKATMYQWVSKYRSEVMQNGVKLSPDDEIKQLRKEVSRLRQEREILKKAAAYFAKHQA
jgi:transposase